MPLSVELGMQGIGTRNTYYSAALQGSLSVGTDKTLSVLAQTNNFFSNLRGRSDITTLSYTTPRWNLSGGTIIDFNHFLVNGHGLRVKRLTRRGGYVDLMGVNGRLENVRQLDLKVVDQLSPQVSFSHNSFINDNTSTGIHSYLTTNRLSWKTGSKSLVSIEGGGGGERFAGLRKDTATRGSMAGYEVRVADDQWTFSSRVSAYSKNFPGLNKGFHFHNHEVAYSSHQYSVGGFYRAYKKQYTSAEDSVLRLLFQTNDVEYALTGSVRRRTGSVHLSAGGLQQQQDSANSLRARMLKLSLNTNWRISPKISVSALSNAGRVRLPERPELGAFWSFTNFGLLQLGPGGVQFRYDRGPFYYYEIRQFANKRGTYKKVQLAPYYEHLLKPLHTFWRLQLNYTREEPLERDYLLAVNQLLYSPTKLNMDLGLWANVDVRGRIPPQVNFTVRKKLLMPLYKNAASHAFSLVLFKDVNGNNKFDRGDQAIPHATVQAGDRLLMSTAGGELQFKDLPGTPVALDFGKVSTAAGWIPKEGLKQVVVPRKSVKNVYIPFKQSKIIMGRLVLVADDKSTLTMELGGIRVTAVDSSGATFSTLTDTNGAFSFSLPAGHYIVSLNPSAFDENFRPSEMAKAANLVLNNAAELTFEVRQRKRQINIRRS